MNDETRMFALTSREPNTTAPVLRGVQAHGRLDGVLFELTLRQTYRNSSDSVLEVIYTFPLPPQAVLLGFACELNGQRQVGSIQPKAASLQRYEEALEAGDAPALLEALPDGMHTASIGNLKPGDEVVLETRIAQALAFEQGRLRLAIPTTIAPRYGNAARAGLEPMQQPQASLLVEYPLSLSITIGGALARGSVECPTHRFSQQAMEDGLRLELAPGAWLDRDVVITVTPQEPWPSLVIQTQDAASQAAPVVVMAALQPPMSAERERIVLKLLVDCSGSMGGASIASARAALQGVLAGLTAQDLVSLSRFGSTVEHLLSPTPCTPHTLRLLKPSVNDIDANLGGTEMQAALQSVFALPLPREAAGADVLLLTDGEIWQTQETLAAARASGHRVFAIGVGSSPAEGVLRALAEATGGACEFATPGEALQAAAARMLRRIRQQPARSTRVDWGCEAVWQTEVPGSVFGGDTVIAFAGLRQPITTQAVRLLTAQEGGAMAEIARGETWAPGPADTLPRMAAARRLGQLSETDAVTLAVTYQLMSPHTNCILVHERSEADRATEPAQLHRVESMLAAGWGGLGRAAPQQAAGAAAPCVLHSASSAMDFDAMLEAPSAAYCAPAGPLGKRVAAPQPASLRAIAQQVAEHLARGAGVATLQDACTALELHPDVQDAIDHAIDFGLTPGQAWLLLAHWTNTRRDGLSDAALGTTLLSHIQALDATLVARCVRLYRQTLGGYALDHWRLGGLRHLRRLITPHLPAKRR